MPDDRTPDHQDSGGLRTAGVSFQGYRPCAARTGWVELLVRVDGRRLSWCVPLGPGDVDDAPLAGVVLALRWLPGAVGGIVLEETDAGGTPRLVTTARALTVLAQDHPPELALDDRLVALPA